MFTPPILENIVHIYAKLFHDTTLNYINDIKTLKSNLSTNIWEQALLTPVLPGNVSNKPGLTLENAGAGIVLLSSSDLQESDWLIGC